MDETRARILDAAVELYETVGPSGTSMSAVAERAGVTRATLYRHFASDADLANAVIDEWSTGNPAAVPVTSADADGPGEHLRGVLVALYGGYQATGAITANLLRDAHVLPAGRRDELRASARRARASLADLGGGSSPAEAAIGHAVAFETWRSLSTEGLSDDAIADLMVLVVEAAGAPALGRAGRRASAASPASADRSKAKSGKPGKPAGGKGKGKADGKDKGPKKAKGERKSKPAGPSSDA